MGRQKLGLSLLILPDAHGHFIRDSFDVLLGQESDTTEIIIQDPA